MIFANRFDGTVMMVTGAAQGIGRAVALRAASEGARVALVDRAAFVTEMAQEILVKDAMASPSYPSAIGIECDLEDYHGARHAMEVANEKFGKIDILINCVGGAIRMKPFSEFRPKEIEAEIRRSLMPTLWCCHAVLPYMRDAGGGVIVNISSNATRGIHRMPYSAAKGGINALTRSLAMEVAVDNIRVLATAPGGTEAPERIIPRNPGTVTDAEIVWKAEAMEQVVESSLMKRFGSLDEQVAAILFLASEESAYMTGTVVPVAGGDEG